MTIAINLLNEQRVTHRPSPEGYEPLAALSFNSPENGNPVHFAIYQDTDAEPYCQFVLQQVHEPLDERYSTRHHSLADAFHLAAEVIAKIAPDTIPVLTWHDPVVEGEEKNEENLPPAG